MREIESILRKEMQELEKLAKQIKSRLKAAPKGKLYIKEKRGYMECYYKSEKDSPANYWKYIKKKEMQLAKEIAQRDYDEIILKNAEARMKVISSFLHKYEKTDLKSIYQEIHPFRKSLLSEVILSDEEYAKRWQCIAYTGKPFSNDESEIITERGERVRSKSEKIIADKLSALEIPYRYEYPLVLGKITIYPDFTILRKGEREEVYLEHFGMMDDVEYVDKALFKLNTYAKNEIYLGVNLFITYETGKRPLNTKVLDGFLRKVFLGVRH